MFEFAPARIQAAAHHYQEHRIPSLFGRLGPAGETCAWKRCLKVCFLSAVLR